MASVTRVYIQCNETVWQYQTSALCLRLCGRHNILYIAYAHACNAAGPLIIELCTLSLQLMLRMRSLLDYNATARAKCSKADTDSGTVQLTRTGVPHQKATAALQLPEFEIPANDVHGICPALCMSLSNAGGRLRNAIL